jgi:hypothetical protein
LYRRGGLRSAEVDRPPGVTDVRRCRARDRRAAAIESTRSHVHEEASMHSIEVKQVKEIILVSDDVQASRRLYRDVLGLAMPAAADRLNLARVGSQ